MSAAAIGVVLRVHPSLASMFPWLSAIAYQYQEYRWLGLVFEYRSTTANAVQANPGLGSVTLASNYDTGMPPYPNKAAALSSLYATSCKPADSMIHPIECSPDTLAKPWFYMHTDGSTNMSKQRLQDMVNLNVITVGAQNDYAGAGELWVTYDILLQKPSVAVTPLFKRPQDPLAHYKYACTPEPEKFEVPFKDLAEVEEERKRQGRISIGLESKLDDQIEASYSVVRVNK